MKPPSQSSETINVPFHAAVGKLDVGAYVVLVSGAVYIRTALDLNDITTAFAVVVFLPALAVFWLAFRAYLVFPRLTDTHWREQLSLTLVSPRTYWRKCIQKRLFAWGLPFIVVQNLMALWIMQTETDDMKIFIIVVMLPGTGWLLCATGTLMYFKRLLKVNQSRSHATLPLAVGVLAGLLFPPCLVALLIRLSPWQEPTLTMIAIGFGLAAVVAAWQWRTCWRGLYDFE